MVENQLARICKTVRPRGMTRWADEMGNRLQKASFSHRFTRPDKQEYSYSIEDEGDERV